jgi:Spy/CpxP family protein refolding chaperone
MEPFTDSVGLNLQMSKRSKTMIKRFLVFSLLLAFIVIANDAFAFGRRGGGMGPGIGPGMGGDFRHLNFIQKELGLTDQQVKQIFDIGTQYRQKRFENRNNPDKLAELRTEHRKAVESVFTKDQLEKLNKFRDDRCRCGDRD